jgi:hypothetical protein
VGKKSLKKCTEHPPNVLLCSCSYARLDFTAPVVESSCIWGKEEIQSHWEQWTPFQRETYLYWREAALDHVRSRVLAARFACDQVYRFPEALIEKQLKSHSLGGKKMEENSDGWTTL